jgi:hypothetical protein
VDRAAAYLDFQSPKKEVNMPIGIATDRGGFGLKEDLLVRLKDIC